MRARGSVAEGNESHEAAVVGDPPGQAMTAKVFTTYDVQACLYDAGRVGYLTKAIRQTVQEGHVVVDAGSGTGLLGLLAAQQGAARVYCLEINPEFIDVIQENARRNGLADRIIAVNGDATTWEPPEPVDVLLCEVISGGFFYEPQLQILNNLRQFLRPGGAVVPQGMTNYLELIYAQDTLYGLRLDYDSRFTDLPDDRTLSTREVFLTTDFYQPHNSPEIAGLVRVRATEAGTANAVRVPYQVQFAPDVCADRPTQFFILPQILYLPQSIELQPEREYEIFLAYQASDSPLRSKIEVRLVA